MWRQLVMETTQHIFPGTRVIVLNKRLRYTCCLHFVLVVAFEKKSAIIVKDARLKEQNSVEIRRDDRKRACGRTRHQNTCSSTMRNRYSPYGFLMQEASRRTCSASMKP